MAFVYALIVPLWADQLLPQHLMEQFDTLQIQCRHIEHMHEGVNNFFVNFFFQSDSFKHMCNVSILYRQSIKLLH